VNTHTSTFHCSFHRTSAKSPQEDSPLVRAHLAGFQQDNWVPRKNLFNLENAEKDKAALIEVSRQNARHHFFKTFS
ncbi:MAG: hypothetical protein OXH71_03235, partial [Candidatus Dadabacteria bacterium]|nr:hypothetical protein [Candidatus Dadabacteria bacterium]